MWTEFELQDGDARQALLPGPEVTFASFGSLAVVDMGQTSIM
jgi:hypothetical protein